MNETTTKLATELAVLAFFGLLYYIWQRRKIIRVDLAELYQSIDEFTFNITEFLNEEDNRAKYPKLIQINKDIHTALQLRELKTIQGHFEEINFTVPSEIEEDIAKIKSQIQFHLK